MYEEAYDEVDKKLKNLLKNKNLQSKIYQAKYQKALLKQIEEILDKIDDYDTVTEFLEACYEDGWIGTMYDITKQGIPLIIPIDQTQAVDALTKETKLKDGLYTRLGYNKKLLGEAINREISRGIATSSSFLDVARSIERNFGINLRKTYTIARTEGHRVMTTASYNAQLSALKMGCNIVKQWDATLDARTRDSHARVDGEIKKVDELFSNGLRYPSDPRGQASEVVNCRCALLQRAKWALDEDELNTLKERASFYGLDKTEQFDDFKKTYLKATNTDYKKAIRRSVKYGNVLPFNFNVLTDDEVGAVKNYVSSDSYFINDALRNGYELDDRRKKIAKDLDNVLKKMDYYVGDVSRSVEIYDEELLKEFLDKHKKGKVVTYNEFISSTANTELYNENANIQLYWTSTKGRDIIKYNKNEGEVLYERGSSFVVKDVSIKDGVYQILLGEVND